MLQARTPSLVIYLLRSQGAGRSRAALPGLQRHRTPPWHACTWHVCTRACVCVHVYVWWRTVRCVRMYARVRVPVHVYARHAHATLANSTQQAWLASPTTAPDRRSMCDGVGPACAGPACPAHQYVPSPKAFHATRLLPVILKPAPAPAGQRNASAPGGLAGLGMHASTPGRHGLV